MQLANLVCPGEKYVDLQPQLTAFAGEKVVPVSSDSTPPSANSKSIERWRDALL